MLRGLRGVFPSRVRTLWFCAGKPDTVRTIEGQRRVAPSRDASNHGSCKLGEGCKAYASKRSEEFEPAVRQEEIGYYQKGISTALHFSGNKTGFWR